MNRQAYGTWQNIIEESIVRAATMRYIFDHKGAEAAREAIAIEERRSFVWTGELVSLLDGYEKDRARYPTLEAFMPRVVSF
jgi:hypothetical protein